MRRIMVYSPIGKFIYTTQAPLGATDHRQAVERSGTPAKMRMVNPCELRTIGINKPIAP